MEEETEEAFEDPDFSDKKAERAFRTISEVSAELNVQQSVLRFWERKFSELSPVQRPGPGGRRYYRPEDVELLKKIEFLLRKEGYTIKGVQKLLKEGRINTVVENLQNVENGKEAASSVQLDEEGLPIEPKPELDSVISELEEIGNLLKKAI